MRRSALRKPALTRAMDTKKPDKSKGLAAPVEGVEGQAKNVGRARPASAGPNLNFKKATKFRKVKPKSKKVDSRATVLNEMEKKNVEWAHYASVLLPKIKLPPRTEEELRNKRKWDLMYRRKLHISWNRQKG